MRFPSVLLCPPQPPALGEVVLSPKTVPASELASFLRQTRQPFLFWRADAQKPPGIGAAAPYILLLPIPVARHPMIALLTPSGQCRAWMRPQAASGLPSGVTRAFSRGAGPPGVRLLRFFAGLTPPVPPVRRRPAARSPGAAVRVLRLPEVLIRIPLAALEKAEHFRSASLELPDQIRFLIR